MNVHKYYNPNCLFRFTFHKNSPDLCFINAAANQSDYVIILKKLEIVYKGIKINSEKFQGTRGSFYS